jgi:predicted RNA-binding protein with PIN domain
MHILVDGYNLIRQSDVLRRYERYSLEAGRQALISKLIDYERKKGHKITVVFDGGESGSAQEERDRDGNIDIIYSRHGEKADDVIKRIAAQTAEETVVVSSDRDIASYITQCGKTALASVEFEVIINKAISASSESNFTAEKKDKSHDRNYKKKGPARRLPRAQRHAQTKIKKL